VSTPNILIRKLQQVNICENVPHIPGQSHKVAQNMPHIPGQSHKVARNVPHIPGQSHKVARNVPHIPGQSHKVARNVSPKHTMNITPFQHILQMEVPEFSKLL